uniref:chorismate mutase n=1 Tax=Thiomonas intermedia (strain K12) TaxID=75379 RepID=D5X2P4_THIK1
MQRMLQTLRSEIDAIDEQLIELLAGRFAVTRQVGQLKAHHALPAVDTERESAQQFRYEQLARANGLDPALVMGLFRDIIAAVVRQHGEAITPERPGSSQPPRSRKDHGNER